MLIPSLVALFVLVLLVASSPLARMPIGPLTALAIVTTDITLGTGAAVAAAAVTLSRALVARAARTSQPGAARPAANDPLRSWLASSPAYGRSTFMAAAIPLIPGRVLFGLLGSMRFPLRYAIAGCVVGQALLISLSAWIWGTLADALTPDERQAALLLGVYAVGLILFRLVTSIDNEAWRTERKLRFRTDADDRRVQMWMSNMQARDGNGQHQQYGSMDDHDIIDADAVEVDDDEDTASRVLPPPPPLPDQDT